MGLDTLNSEIKKLGLPNEFSINSKISEQDGEFIRKLLCEVEKISKLEAEILSIKNGIKNLYLKDNSDPHLMGELEKKLLFNHILSHKIESILMPFFEVYSEENFWQLYNWHIEWIKKSNGEKHNAIDLFIRNTSIEDLGRLREIQKLGISQFIYFYESSTLSIPKSSKFDVLIKWYKEWITKTDDEKEIEEFNAELELNDSFEKKHTKSIKYDVFDEESAIMSALAHGDGDKYGFE